MPHHCDPPTLQQFITCIFQRVGAEADIAGEVASYLVRSNLSGHDSHGVIRVVQYIGQVDNGDIVPSARPVLMSAAAVTALVDARRSFGLYSTMFALDWTMERARQHGIACAAVRHSTHIGRLGEYAEKAASQGLIAIVTVGVAGPGVGGMIPFGGAKRFLGANPWCIGVPVAEGPPLVFDGSTSTIAEGKVRVARAKGDMLPPDSIIDSEGRVSRNPEDFYAGGGLVPLGGQAAGHKGYGLALMSALLGGLCMINDDNPTLIGAQVREKVADEGGRMAGVLLIVIDPKAFGDSGHYREMVSGMTGALRRVPPAAAVERVLLSGEPEVMARQQRSREGLQIPDPVWQDLTSVAQRFGIELPN